MIYFPQLGYLIATPNDMLHPSDWELQFQTDSNSYYKNDKMRDLDQELGDIHGMIVDREIDVMFSLVEEVLQVTEPILKASEVLAELDCILALAETARRHKYVRPMITAVNVLDIKKGR